MNERYQIMISGIVQGVGFRPFIYQLAEQYGLSGWVSNTAGGVLIEVEGDNSNAFLPDGFISAIKEKKPALARVDQVLSEKISPLHDKGFTIRASISGAKQTLISADMGICEKCLSDIRDPANRRYQYAFTNCTNCGPRFSIIKDLPYDREQTTMSHFCQCAECEAEYLDPKNRRFHAEPNACPTCGPRLSYLDADGNMQDGEPLSLAKQDIKDGKIIAVKGIGGYHLVCDAQNEQAVAKLRGRKHRYDKPFAVMMANLDIISEYCCVDEQDIALLSSQRRPIVLLKKQQHAKQVAAGVAPNNSRLGVMLPYTPLHYMLMDSFSVLVMTSANVSDEPIVYQDAEIMSRLSFLVDGILTHNREIFRRADDSVLANTTSGSIFLRRSRGFAPEPLFVENCGKNILATGAEQKNTFCLSRGNQAFCSQHIGELDNESTYQSYKQEIAYFSKMFNVKPQVVAYDMHSAYLSHRYALFERSETIKIPVQHHHAHLASVLAEHKMDAPAIGLIYDGTGLGTDGSLWGGEVLVGDKADSRRYAHLLPLMLPGGEKAITEPWRSAMSALFATYGQDDFQKCAPPGLLADGWQILSEAMQAGINSPSSSGMGRLFDIVAALIGIGRFVNYEGQAAVELEQAMKADISWQPYQFTISKEEQPAYLLDWRPLIKAIIDDLANDIEKGMIAARFHQAVVDASCRVVLLAREETGISTVALSGGCWQNLYLLEQTYAKLTEKGFSVLYNQSVPINDGGIAYGQLAVAAARISKGEY